MLNLIPCVVFFQVVLVPVFAPHIVGTPASWLFSSVFSLGWNFTLLIVIKVRDRGVAKAARG